ncbi:helix-turn-helix domain-containing protein [Actinoplanes sp. NPDC051513]|uniref:helix-turn-helix domain-containing protein n=1 Tax=Actinoplanes sp. NPDC051513 TaxID=3363908 RepID=UPI0037A65A23
MTSDEQQAVGSAAMFAMGGRADEQADNDPLQRFAAFIRHNRQRVGWTQKHLAESAGVSRPTVQRYENAKSEVPQPSPARAIFGALGLDVRLIPVLLGYVTADEVNAPPPSTRLLSALAEEAVSLLDDPAVSDDVKEEWVAFLRFRTGRT